MRVFLRVYPIVFVLSVCFASNLFGQDLEPEYVEAKVLQGETYTYPFISFLPADLHTSENVGNPGSVDVNEIVRNQDYEFVYATDPNFIGESRFIIELYSVVGLSKKFTEVVVRVVPSLLEVVQDVAFVSEGNSTVTIDALSNDLVGNGASSIISVDLVSNGSAEIVNNQIVFTKGAGFEGITSFNYTIQDESGYKSSGVITVNVQGDARLAGSTQRYLTDPFTPVVILIDDPSYEFKEDVPLVLGDLESQETYHFTYLPKSSSVGIETFNIENGDGESITIVIEILDDNHSSLLVRDDIYYTSIGTDLVFNPRENDFSLDGIVYAQSTELSYDGTNFTYSPPDGFSGVKTFFYEVLDGTDVIRGEIEIYVGDYLPQLSEYRFETYENTPFVIEYDSPLLNFQWTLNSEPSDGSMSMNVGSYSGSSCDVISGDRMVIYTPDDGFIGTDYFTIEYCVSNGACKSVDVTIEVKATDETCPCFGSDCVWAGDADNDGKVSVKDILPIGYNYGETGSGRGNNQGGWGANHATDWPFDQDESDINNKFADGDGDGIINATDAAVLGDNLRLYHNINAEEVLAQKDVPLVLVARTPPPYKGGDLVVFDVFVGNEDIPVEDLRGLVFSVGFPTDIVDPNSIKYTQVEAWLGNSSPVLSAVDINEGVLSVGLARTADVGVFGDGRIGETRLVIRSDLDGTRPNGDQLPLEINLGGAVISNSAGKKFGIDAKSISLLIDLDQTEADQRPEVVAYPNPSDNQLTFYANNNDELIDVKIYNMMGGVVLQYQNINQKSIDITHSLPQGVYSVAIKTQKGLAVDKVQVIR